jgi:hypothetical protein
VNAVRFPAVARLLPGGLERFQDQFSNPKETSMRKHKVATQAQQPVPLAKIEITLEPPAGWTDADYDAALQELEDIGILSVFANAGRLHLGSRYATDKVSVKVKYQEDVR